MIKSLEKDKLYKLLKDFYTVLGIRIAVFDHTFELLAEYPKNPPRLCAVIRSSKNGLDACKKCDKDAFLRAKCLSAAHSYICHAGVTEAITPLRVNGMIVGYAIFAHLLPKENFDFTVSEICRRCKNYFESERDIKNAVEELKRYSAEEISAIMSLLEVIAYFLQLSNAVNWKNEDFAFNLDEHISNNIREKLSSDELCSRFYISRTKLYQISKEAFGMSISRYITKKRMEMAKTLLKDEKISVASVAENVGVADYNYFCKLFKKEVGTSPKKWASSSRSTASWR